MLLFEAECPTVRAVAESVVSLQIEILKVLSGRLHGRASIENLKAELAFFNSIGLDWTGRMRRLAAHAAQVNIFSDGFVVRDREGWQLTSDGREFLASIEAQDRSITNFEIKGVGSPSDLLQPTPDAEVVYIDQYRSRCRGTSPSIFVSRRRQFGGIAQPGDKSIVGRGAIGSNLPIGAYVRVAAVLDQVQDQ
jgi:hypothetical protein